MSDKLNSKISSSSFGITKQHYNPNNIRLKKNEDISLNIDSEDNIFTFICSNKNNKDNNKFLALIYKLEEKVKKNIENQNIEKLSSSYLNFNFDIRWVDNEYKKLIVKQISEDLITDNIIEILKKS